MKIIILRLILTVLLLWRVYLGDRWALILTLALLTLHAEMVAYQLMKLRRGLNNSIDWRQW